MTHAQWKRCNRCGNALMGNEQRGDTCNRCLDLGYASMSDEEYGALDLATHEEEHTMAQYFVSGTTANTIVIDDIDGGLYFSAYDPAEGAWIDRSVPVTTDTLTDLQQSNHWIASDREHVMLPPDPDFSDIECTVSIDADELREWARAIMQHRREVAALYGLA